MGQWMAAVLEASKSCDARECDGEREQCGVGAAKGTTVRSTQRSSATSINTLKLWPINNSGKQRAAVVASSMSRIATEQATLVPSCQHPVVQS
jgi:hypothetical protein